MYIELVRNGAAIGGILDQLCILQVTYAYLCIIEQIIVLAAF